MQGNKPTNELSANLKDLVERKRTLRLEHNHGDMKWYAYYAGRGQRNLFETDLYENGDNDWQTASDTPDMAVLKLLTIMRTEDKQVEHVHLWDYEHKTFTDSKGSYIVYCKLCLEFSPEHPPMIKLHQVDL